MGHVQAVLFDLFGTLVDIYTDEEDIQVYRTLAQFLSYYQIYYTAEDLKRLYREIGEARLTESQGPYGEIDVFYVFEAIVAEARGKLPDRHLVIWLARLFRSLTRRHLALFPDTRPCLEKLQKRYQLGIITDAQWVYSEPEIRMLGLDKYFPSITLSSRYLVRKPAPQIYAHALRSLQLDPAEAVYVGNSYEEDVPGPKEIGLPVVLVDRWGGLENAGVPLIHDLQQLPQLLEDLEKAG